MEEAHQEEAAVEDAHQEEAVVEAYQKEAAGEDPGDDADAIPAEALGQVGQ